VVLSEEKSWAIPSLVAAVVAVIVLALFWGVPRWRVYSQRLAGEARLAEAESSRQIRIHEAKARLEAAEHDKAADIMRAEGWREAEVIRAEGAKQAADIIQQTLTEEYLHYRWIEGLHDGTSEVMYIATEAGIPLMKSLGGR
jgi:predicted Holliday junction resolvase-like endonuclease